MMIDARDNGAGLGATLFGNLRAALFIAIWLLEPLLTADCFSRERREGTLGILFLTPLTARTIIIRKGPSVANLLVLRSGFQSVFALMAVTRLYRNLRHRKFALAP